MRLARLGSMGVVLALGASCSVMSAYEDELMTAGAPSESRDADGRADRKVALEMDEEEPAAEPSLLIIQGAKVRAEEGSELGFGGSGNRQAFGSIVSKPAAAPPPPPPGGGGSSETAVREWFPEAFLWQPRVETDDDGLASVDVRVPDQLTTWRVLALAHDRAGHQSGAVHSFDSTLPAYVDPVVPGWMYVGDELVLPIQVVNNRNAAASSGLAVRADGALSGQMSAQVAVGAFGSSVQAVSVLGESAGTAVLSADLTGVDAVRREWPVNPTGRPVSRQRGGVLTGTKSFALDWPDGTDPRTGRFQVEVHPGPLAVLTTELERIGAGGRAPGAYAYGLSAHLTALAEASGAELDEPTVRALKIRAWQRLVRAARSPDAGQAADLLTSLQGAEDGALLENLRARLVRTVVSGQRGDGTWARQDRDTLQRVLVQTAVAMRSLPESETGAVLRAEGALERNLPNVDDSYTAAVLLATGRVSNTELLESLVRDALVEVPSEGRSTVVVPEGVQCAWGGPPSRAEVLAWTALALQPRHPDVAGDLVAELMTLYSGDRGFGAGPADALALEAVVQALPTIDQPVRLTLKANGKVVASAAVDPAQPKVPAVLEMAHPGVPLSEIEIVAEPAGAGLSFVGTQRAWVPWDGSQGLAGVELEVAQSPLRAGREGTLTLTISAPSSTRVRVVQGLPAGVAVDADRLKAQAGVAEVDVQQDRFSLTTKSFGAGEVLEIPVHVTPTYAGSMVSRPLEVSVGSRSGMLAPHRWVVGR
ncbi:MAG: alpha-2-macroglobulin family protein [Myxococcota bacterium]